MEPRQLSKGLLREPGLKAKPPQGAPEPNPVTTAVDSAFPLSHTGTIVVRMTMSLQTMSSADDDLAGIPDEVAVQRSDPAYNAHGYLTKVPVTAIEPFVAALSSPGGVVLDCFAGSGMTGVAAAVLGRRAQLVDISELGGHIGRNYVNLVDPEALRAAAAEAVRTASARLHDPYTITCERCGKPGELSRRTWSVTVQCHQCKATVNYYRSLEAAGWQKTGMTCPACRTTISVRGTTRVGEEPVLDTVSSDCSDRLLDQQPGIAEPGPISGADLRWPDVEIEQDRQMFQASALGKHGRTTVADFFSPRNLRALAALRDAVMSVSDAPLRDKLMFGFTAILPRASKRYQWSRQRPLNAANQNYYIAPVFYEWNAFDLFSRKVDAIVRSDDYIREKMRLAHLVGPPQVTYTVASAEALPLEDESVDYVFTDPPFGSNIFYSDMNLFQEAWLGRFTDHRQEAVVDRSGPPAERRTAERYERLLASAFKECWRVLKPDHWLTVVFSNSRGGMWALLQRALRAAGFQLEPMSMRLLDKGQRSVKGLASGYEHVVTVDLIVSVRKRPGRDQLPALRHGISIEDLLDRVLVGDARFRAPSHVYLAVIRECLREDADPTDVSFSAVVSALKARGFRADPGSGKFVEQARAEQGELWEEIG